MGPTAGLDVLEKTQIFCRCSNLIMQLNMDCVASIATCIQHCDMSICIYRPHYTQYFVSEAWVLKKREEQRLEAAQMKFLRHLLGITNLHKEKSQCTRQKTGTQNIVKEIKQYQKKWLQHKSGVWLTVHRNSVWIKKTN